MATVNYTLRVNEADKQNAEQVFKNLGMTFATGINIYIKTVGRQQRIPFNMDLSEPPANLQFETLKEAFKALQHESSLNGVNNMTMDEINAEIQAHRSKKKAHNA